MPMGKGKLFLPVNASVRKIIGKQGGDLVRVVFSEDRSPYHIPEELVMCLNEDSEVSKRFMELSESEKKAFTDWIYSSKQEDIKITKIARMMDMMQNGRRRPF